MSLEITENLKIFHFSPHFRAPKIPCFFKGYNILGHSLPLNHSFPSLVHGITQLANVSLYITRMTFRTKKGFL